VENVTAKLGNEIEAVGGPATVEDGKLSGPGFALSYLDDEGDSVSITTDQDLLEAILIARQNGRDKVDLFVHDPEKPPSPVPVTSEQPAASHTPTPPASTIRERRRVVSDEDEESEEEQPVRRARKTAGKSTEDQVIAGVPNELLLPGAIVTLAVVIVGVFALTRATSR